MRSLLLRAALACALALTTLSCASSSVFQLSADEQAGLRLAMDTPLTFLVPRDRSIKTWDRAQEFIDRYSTMKLRSVTDSSLVTYETPSYTSDPSPVAQGSGIRFGYSVSRASDPDGIQIHVKLIRWIYGVRARAARVDVLPVDRRRQARRALQSGRSTPG